MSNTKFTKGDWRVDYYTSIDQTIRVNKGNIIICHNNASTEWEANAHLIAAAPEMYDLLSTIENDNEQVPEWLWNKIQETLAKARGEQ